MTNISKNSATMPVEENTSTSIMNRDEIISINYKKLENYHEGNSCFDCSVDFCAMQAAANICTQTSIWSRDHLYIVSEYPGLGVENTIELITHCVSEKRFRLLDDMPTEGCNRDMKFEWLMDNSLITVHVKPDDNFVPEFFYNLPNRLNFDIEKYDDHESFNQHKDDLSHQLWQQPLEDLFNVNVLFIPLNPGDLPGSILDA